ncbi:DNA internalization-related competence protein ComEC/Rec2 [Methylovorus sp. MM2]|uniref:DNA internalization-related competence protein ComEC/Rec2 n=1 Tax=Methylovorus sp. MM2 TaxID=1848038 RepID=UPI000AE8DC67|nr:DNA internalization-related competence protein ComEC/Rec2 [Methylovorus sp. MM2]
MTLFALTFVFGVWVLQQQAVLPSPFWSFALLPLALLLFVLRGVGSPAGWLSRRILMVVLAMAAGFFWATGVAQYRLSDTLPHDLEGKDIQVIGVVAGMPQLQDGGARFEFDVEQVLTADAVVPTHISLAQRDNTFFGNKSEALLATVQPFHAGERWQLHVKLTQPHGILNPYGFDFESWALERNIRATGYIRKNADNRLITNFVMRPGYIVEVARERIRERMRHVLGNAPCAGILQALAIGDDKAISTADWQVFLRTGVNHLISISGLHITMLSGLAFTLVLMIWRRVEWLVLRVPARKAAIVVGAVVAMLYALIAGFSVPTQRTLYMLSVFAIALWSGRHVSIARVLAYALLLVVFLDPWAVLAPGFWLSFGAVAIITYALGGRLQRPHWLRESISTQWAVTLGLIPLLLVLFQQFSLISPVANAIAIPLVSLVVVPLTLLGALSPFDWALHLAHWVMNWGLEGLRWLSAFPLSTWQQHAPPAWTLPVAILGILWILLPRGFPMRWLGLAGLLPMFLLIPPVPAVGAMRVTVLDVGQGLSVVVKTASHALLYDAGPKYSAQNDSGSRIVVPYLRATGVSSLDGFVISHDDLDHSGGAPSVLAQVPVSWVLSSLPDTSDKLINVKHIRCFAGQRWVWDDVHFELISPEYTSYGDAAVTDNNRSCVLRVSSRFGSILLPGDIEKQAEANMVSNNPEIFASDVIVAPHHGSKTSSTQDFIAAVHPSIVVFAMGYRNRFGHPNVLIANRYAEMNARAYRSDDDGAITLDFASERGIAITRSRVADKRYWHAD